MIQKLGLGDPTRPSRLAFGALVVALTLVVWACGGGGDTKTPTAKACAARSELDAAVQKIHSAVGAGDLDDAKSGVAKLTTAYNDMASVLEQLPAAERESLGPVLEPIQGAVTQFSHVSSVDGAKVAFQQTQPDLQSAQATLHDNLHC